MIDHPYPELDVFPSVPIPSLTGNGQHECCVSLGLEEFPGLIRFPDVVGSEALSNSIPIEDRASLMQAWLFYAFLEKISGSCVVGTKIASVRSVDHTLSTEIHNIWMEKLRRLQSLSIYDRNGEYSQLRKTLAFVLRQFAKFDQTRASASSDVAHVALSVAFLLETVRYHCCHDVNYPYLLDLHDWPQTGYDPSTYSVWRSVLYDRMRKLGWCPIQINDVISNVSFLELYFLSSLQRSSRPSDHAHCRFGRCAAVQFNPQTFSPLHRRESCSCSSTGPDLDKVESILRTGELPLIRIQHQNGSLNLKVVKAKSSSQYVAISHVWSDRQFGSYSNTIPQCQVEYLNERILRLPVNPSRLKRPFVRTQQDQGRLFWLDTFCIPVEPNDCTLRTQAIQMMDYVYGRANTVLAFDSELQRLPVQHDLSRNGSRQPPEQDDPETQRSSTSRHIMPSISHRTERLRLLGYVYVCRWMQRAWTYQEQLLSHKCYLQFEDTAIPIDDLWVTDATREEVTWWFRETRAHSFREHLSRLYCYLAALQGSMPWSIFAILFLSVIYPVVLFVVWMGFHLLNLSPTFNERYPNRWSMTLWLQDFFWMQRLPRIDFKTYLGMDECTRFIKVWNDLQSRYTTKTEDMVTILTGLTGYFQPPKDHSRSQEKTLQSLIMSLDEIPIDLLFSSTPRSDINPLSDGWIPTTLQGRLDEQNTLKKLSKGYVFDMDMCSAGCFILPPEMANLQRFSVRYGSDRKSVICVHCTCPTLNESSGPDSRDVCIMIKYEHASRTMARGARMRVSRKDNETDFLEYDCPLLAVNLLKAQEEDLIRFLAAANEPCSEQDVLSAPLTSYPLKEYRRVEDKRRYILKPGMLPCIPPDI